MLNAVRGAWAKYRVNRVSGHFRSQSTLRNETQTGPKEKRFSGYSRFRRGPSLSRLACRMFRLAGSAGSRFHRESRICDRPNLDGHRFGVSWCSIINKVLGADVVSQEPLLVAVFAKASGRHIHDLPLGPDYQEQCIFIATHGVQVMSHLISKLRKLTRV